MKMVRWEDYAPFLKLSEAEQEEICRENERNYRAQKRDALRVWRDKCGRAATYRSFLNEVERVNKRSSAKTKSTGAFETFRRYLVECDAVASHPSQDSWPFSQDAAYVDLPLFEVSTTQSGSEQSAQPLRPVELSDIFLTGSHMAKRKVVLLEGVAGCGKTTLIWHAYQRWAEEKLFDVFPLLIRVPLDDPDVRSATCLADIIPHPSSEMRKAIAKLISEQHVKGVCFLLDGWDELPPHARHKDSFLFRLIAGKGREKLSHCSVVVTSRPTASGALYRLLTSRIVVGRLDKRRVDDLIGECLTPEGTEELLKILEQRPQLANLCNLPINATIVIHLFRRGVRTFPETRTGLFRAMLCNLLIRHIRLRTEEDDTELGELFDFEEMPDDLLVKFTTMCRLAFKGIMEDSRVFKLDALKSLRLSYPSDTFSLMEAHLNIFGQSKKNYTFLHFSVQEFLAAWHMARLGSDEQAKAVLDVLQSHPLSPVLPFFAGLSGLSNPAVRDHLEEVTKYPLDPARVLDNRPQTEGADRRRLALALVNCIYESQCSKVCEHAVDPGTFRNVLDKTDDIISFQALSLEPTDCLSIGYFLANQSSCFLSVQCCSIGDAGYEAMMMQLKQSAETDPVPSSHRWLNLAGNPIARGDCMKMVADVLQTPLLTGISFISCWPPTQVRRNLTYLIEGLSRRSTPIQLTLHEAITRAHTYYMVLLIATCPLNVLYLNQVGEGLSFLAEAVKHTRTLDGLALQDCKVGDRELIDLARKARTIRKLILPDNHFTTSAVQKLFQYHYFSTLERLDIGRPLNREEKAVHKKLQDYRTKCRMPPLNVTDIRMPAKTAGFAASRTYSSLPKNVRERKKE